MTSSTSKSALQLGKILVVGGTGMLGIPVVRQLASDGHFVRVLSRDSNRAKRIFRDVLPNMEIIQGNIEDSALLKQALEGCTGIHINLSGGELEHIGTEQILSLIAEQQQQQQSATTTSTLKAMTTTTFAGNDNDSNHTATTTTTTHTLQRITFISGISTCEENARRFPKTMAKFLAEQAIQSSGIDYTIFRCTMFMETLPKWKFLVGKQPTKWHWIAASDYASMVSKAFVTPEAANKIFYICGPGPSLTLKEAMDQYYIPICEPERKYIPTFPKWIVSAVSWMIPGKEYLQTSTLADLAWLSQISELGNPQEANEILGKPKLTIGEWCAEYKKQTISTA